MTRLLSLLPALFAITLLVCTKERWLASPLLCLTIGSTAIVLVAISVLLLEHPPAQRKRGVRFWLAQHIAERPARPLEPGEILIVVAPDKAVHRFLEDA